MDEPSPFPEIKEPPQKKQAPKDEAYIALSKNVTALGSRLRVLEEQYSNVRNKAQLTDKNLLEYEKDVKAEMKTLYEDILELKKTLQDLKEKINIISSELGNTVEEHEFRVVEKYVDLWNPGQFVTKEKLKEAIEGLKKD